MSTTRTTRDRGQAAIAFTLLTSVMFVVLVAALTTLGQRVVARSQAQNAADAVALSSLDGGRTAAETMARRHGAVVVSWSRGPSRLDVTVVVAVSGAMATARASNEP